MKVAILSDVHANLPALDVVLSDIRKNKCDHVFILGDLVGYYHWPKEVVEKIMNLQSCTVIRGNHEDLLKRSRSDDNFAFFCKKRYGSGLETCIKFLTEEQMLWLDSLPVSKRIILDGIRFGLFHGSEIDVEEYIYPDCCQDRVNNIAADDLDYVFFGHTHYPVIFTSKKAIVANPGSVGQPRDVGSLASYLILNTKNRALTQRRLPFDSEAVKAKSLEHDSVHIYSIEILKRNNPYV